jgi:hypothetical protein
MSKHPNGQVYRYTTTGTLGTAGTPTGTGSNIQDGSAVWTYVEANPVWHPIITL